MLIYHLLSWSLCGSDWKDIRPYKRPLEIFFSLRMERTSSILTKASSSVFIMYLAGRILICKSHGDAQLSLMQFWTSKKKVAPTHFKSGDHSTLTKNYYITTNLFSNWWISRDVEENTKYSYRLQWLSSGMFFLSIDLPCTMSFSKGKDETYRRCLALFKWFPRGRVKHSWWEKYNHSWPSFFLRKIVLHIGVPRHF